MLFKHKANNRWTVRNRNEDLVSTLQRRAVKVNETAHVDRNLNIERVAYNESIITCTR